MSPDDEKKLRQLMLMKRKLPEPNWNLLARATKKMSRFAERLPSIEAQAGKASAVQAKRETAQKKEFIETNIEAAKEAFEKQERDLAYRAIIAQGKLKDKITDNVQRKAAITQFNRDNKEAKKERKEDYKKTVQNLKDSIKQK